MTSAIEKYTKSEDFFERFALTRNAIEWWDSVNFDSDALRDDSSKVGKQIAGKVTEAAITSAAGSNGYSGHAATDWVMEHGDKTQDIDTFQKSVRAFYQHVLKGQAQLFLPGTSTRSTKKPSLVTSVALISEDERNANFSVMMRRVVLQPTSDDMRNASRMVAEAVVTMLGKPDEQIGQYNKAIGKLQAELREKLKNVGEFKDVVLVNAGPLSDEIKKLNERIETLEEEIVKLNEDFSESEGLLLSQQMAEIEAGREVDRLKKEIPEAIEELRGTALTIESILNAVNDVLK